MKTKALSLAAAAMLLSSCMLRINSSSTAPEPAASAEAAVSMADSAATKGFTRIEAYGSFDVYYTPGDTTAIRLEGDTASTRRTIVSGDGKTLTISTARDRDFFDDRKYNMKVHITAPTLSEIGINGSGDFFADNGISSDKLAVHMAGAGDTRLKGVKANSLSIDIAGAGDAYVSDADTKSANFAVAGAGDVNIDGIKADGFRASIAGAGDIGVKRADIRKADFAIAGAGSIDVTGRVDKYDKSIAGAGSVSVKRQ